MAELEVVEVKPWYLSKILWVNALAMLALVVQTRTGFVIGGEEQAAILMVANILLRAFLTKQPLGKGTP